MNDSTPVHPPRRAWPPIPGTVPAIVAAVALAGLVVACGGGPAPAGSGGPPDAGRPANTPSAVGFSRCVRSHGVPNYPDPGSGGALPKTSAQQIGVSDSLLQAAQRACQHLLPSTESFQQRTQACMLTGNCPQALVRQITAAELRFARCMRSHGVPDWPDPTIDSQGRPVFDVSAHGLDPHHSPQLNTKVGACERRTGNPPVPLG